jgi:cell division septation protein DedD
MAKRLRSWIATSAETRTVWVIASLCIAVTIGAFLWPQIKPDSDSGKSSTLIKPPAAMVKRPESASLHRPVQTKPAVPPKKASKQAGHVKPAPPTLPNSVPPKQMIKPVASTTLASGYYVQLGAFKDQKRARTLFSRLSPTWKTHIASRPNGMLAVWVGPYRTSKEASRYREKIASAAKLKGFVVKH